jgi:hypothetical protein
MGEKNTLGSAKAPTRRGTGRPWRKGTSGNPSGRPKGRLNRTTIEIREVATRMLTDARYLRNLRRRLHDGTAGQVETLLFKFAYGEPPAAQSYTVEEVSEFLSAITRTALRHITSAAARAAFAADLDLATKGGVRALLALDLPAPRPWADPLDDAGRREVVALVERDPRLRASVEAMLLARSLPAHVADEPDEVEL